MDHCLRGLCRCCFTGVTALRRMLGVVMPVMAQGFCGACNEIHNGIASCLALEVGGGTLRFRNSGR